MLVVPKSVGICRVVEGGGLVWLMFEDLLMVRGHDVFLVIMVKWVGEAFVRWEDWRWRWRELTLEAGCEIIEGCRLCEGDFIILEDVKCSSPLWSAVPESMAVTRATVVIIILVVIMVLVWWRTR